MALTGWRGPIKFKDGHAVGCLETEHVPGVRREFVFAEGGELIKVTKYWCNAETDPPPTSTPVLVWGRPERDDEPEVGLEQLHDDGLWYGWYEITHWRELPAGPEGE